MPLLFSVTKRWTSIDERLTLTALDGYRIFLMDVTRISYEECQQLIDKLKAAGFAVRFLPSGEASVYKIGQVLLDQKIWQSLIDAIK